MELKNLTIKKFNQGLIGKKFSATEAAKAFFDYIEKKDGKIGGYLRLTKDLALNQAKQIDNDIAVGKKIEEKEEAEIEMELDLQKAQMNVLMEIKDKINKIEKEIVDIKSKVSK